MSGLGVVLSGGGARGAYEAGVLSYIFRDVAGEVGRVPRCSVVSGTSVGAVNGTFFASTLHDTAGGVTRLEELWHELEITDVLRFGVRQMTGLHRVLLGGSRARGLLDASPLASLVGDGVGWKQLRRNISRGVLDALTITTTDVATGHPYVFVDAAEGTALPTGLPATVRSARILPSHVLASASIPLIFPPVRIGQNLHCDGGLRLNTPMAPAIHMGATRLLVVGVSTPTKAGESSLPPGRYPGAPFLMGKVLNAFLLDHLNSDLLELERINQYLEDGIAEFGEGFVQKMNERASRRGDPSRTLVQALSIRPSIDIGRIAADHLRTHRARFGRALGRSFLRLLDVGEGGDADLASYLLFDGAFARELMEMGRRDAREKRDEIEAFLFDE